MLKRNLSFRESGEGVFVFIHDFLGYFQRLFKIRIVRDRLEATASEFNHVKELAAPQIETLHEFTGQDKSVGIADLLDFEAHCSFRSIAVIHLYNAWESFVQRM